MRITYTKLPEVLLLHPEVYEDTRGFVFESYNEKEFLEATGQEVRFIQDVHSSSKRNVLRGLHYQIKQPQGKLIRVTAGTVFDVAVDLRKSSPRFGYCVTTQLSAEGKNLLWIPPGFAHGFLVLSERADIHYKATAYYAPRFERCLAWNDPDLAIAWPLAGAPILSDKDRAGVLLRDAEVYP
ncbi:MAG: dTDP-4-dehydrorhamnose 3,5-epimerase [Pseudomonadota bacterium]